MSLAPDTPVSHCTRRAFFSRPNGYPCHEIPPASCVYFFNSFLRPGTVGRFLGMKFSFHLSCEPAARIALVPRGRRKGEGFLVAAFLENSSRRSRETCTTSEASSLLFPSFFDLATDTGKERFEMEEVYDVPRTRRGQKSSRHLSCLFIKKLSARAIFSSLS